MPRPSAYRRAGWDTPAQYMAMKKRNKEIVDGGTYDTSLPTPQELARPEVARAFYDWNTSGGRLSKLRILMVDVLHRMTPAQFDAKYGNRPFRGTFETDVAGDTIES